MSKMVTIEHPTLGTAQCTERSFERVWSARGYTLVQREVEVDKGQEKADQVDQSNTDGQGADMSDEAKAAAAQAQQAEIAQQAAAALNPGADETGAGDSTQRPRR